MRGSRGGETRKNYLIDFHNNNFTYFRILGRMRKRNHLTKQVFISLLLLGWVLPLNLIKIVRHRQWQYEYSWKLSTFTEEQIQVNIALQRGRLERGSKGLLCLTNLQKLFHNSSIQNYVLLKKYGIRWMNFNFVSFAFSSRYFILNILCTQLEYMSTVVLQPLFDSGIIDFSIISYNRQLLETKYIILPQPQFSSLFQSFEYCLH